jgi:hypothetical protein
LDRTVNVFTLTLLKTFFPLDKLLVGLVYRSPSNRTSENSDNMCSLISEATNKGYSHILIMGDFNYPDIDWENWNTKGVKSKFRTQWSLFPSGLACSRFDIMVSSFVTIKSNIWGVSVPRHLVVSSYVDIDTNWSTFLTLLRDLEHMFIPTKTINMNGRRRNTFPIDKKTRDLIKRKNTLSKKVASSSDHPIRHLYLLGQYANLLFPPSFWTLILYSSW